MKYSIIFACALTMLLLGLSVFVGNKEFLLYGVTVGLLVGIIHYLDRRVHFTDWVLWMFNGWLVAHIVGGLVTVGGVAMYSYVLVPLVGEPYSILKYDQVVHWYCYLVMALLVWEIAQKYIQTNTRWVLVVLVVFAAAGIGGLNEIIEFAATVLIADVNVGGYENTAIDIVANMLGALSAIPLFKKIDTP